MCNNFENIDVINIITNLLLSKFLDVIVYHTKQITCHHYTKAT